MRRHIIVTIFQKEIKEVLRDKRMLYLIILLPFFLYPVLFTLIGGVGASQKDKLEKERIQLLLNPEAEHTPVYELLKKDTNFNVSLVAWTNEQLDTLSKTIGVYVPADYSNQLKVGMSVLVTIATNHSKDVLAMRARSIQAQLQQLGNETLTGRLAEKSLSMDFITPIHVDNIDLAADDNSNRMMASFLPMMILLFIFIGCIYIAIDITAGEKERRTLQTLFTAPLTTLEIISGKFLAVISVGIISAAMNVLSLLMAMKIQAYLLSDEAAGMALSLTPDAWGWLIALVVLATLFMGAISLAIVLLANSYKEAQTYVSPLMMLILIPAMMAAMPGAELTMQSALIPIYNIALAIVVLMKGTYEIGVLTVVLAASLMYGGLALFLAKFTFSNESVITGEKVDWKLLLKR